MFKDLYEHYQDVYISEKEGRIPELERRDLQNKLSSLLVEGQNDSTICNYLEKVRYTSNTNTPKDRFKLPHLDEASYSTIRLKETGVEISEQFRDKSKAIMMFGSGTWGAFYSTRNKSDLDLEIIIPEFSTDLLHTPILEEHGVILSDGIQLANENKIDMILYRFDYQGIDTMLHFIPQKNFEKLISLEFQNLDDGFYGFTELRNYYRGNPNHSGRCSFVDNKRDWIANYAKQRGEWHYLNLPVCQIEEQTLYNGIFTEWHLTPPIILSGDKDWLLGQTEKLFNNFIERVKVESARDKKGYKFVNLLERKYNMPQWLLNSIEEKSETKFK